MPPCKSISDTSSSLCLAVGIWCVSCCSCDSRPFGDKLKYFTKDLHILSLLMMEVHLGGNFTKTFVCRSPPRTKSRHKAFELSPKKRELNLFLGHTPPNYPLTLQYIWDILEWKIKKNKVASWRYVANSWKYQVIWWKYQATNYPRITGNKLGIEATTNGIKKGLFQ